MSRIRLSVLLFCLASCLASAARAGEGDTQITDPALLTRLGFRPDARNVYLAKGVVLGARPAASAPEEFGTLDPGWITVLGSQHISGGISTRASVDGSGDIYLVSGAPTYDAQLQMPNGALFQGVRWYGRDNSASYLEGAIFSVCQAPTGTVFVTILGEDNGNGMSDEFSFDVPVAGGGIAVNNSFCSYFARTTFLAEDVNLRLRKIRAQWQRQVSPAPATATFPNDVPTTHPYFRFVEALAGAGITAGCAPDSYCPDSPITRGEMAVFLSAALGLHWP